MATSAAELLPDECEQSEQSEQSKLLSKIEKCLTISGKVKVLANILSPAVKEDVRENLDIKSIYALKRVHLTLIIDLLKSCLGNKSLNTHNILSIHLKLTAGRDIRSREFADEWQDYIQSLKDRIIPLSPLSAAGSKKMKRQDRERWDRRQKEQEQLEEQEQQLEQQQKEYWEQLGLWEEVLKDFKDPVDSPAADELYCPDYPGSPEKHGAAGGDSLSYPGSPGSPEKQGAAGGADELYYPGSHEKQGAASSAKKQLEPGCASAAASAPCSPPQKPESGLGHTTDTNFGSPPVVNPEDFLDFFQFEPECAESPKRSNSSAARRDPKRRRTTKLCPNCNPSGLCEVHAMFNLNLRF